MKRLVFCFDGTWNRLEAACPTNVVLTAESTLPLASDNTAQLIYYDEGVGTARWESFRGGVFGMGLDQNLADAYRFLIFNYTPGDEIYIFGFSRGAYTARSFAGLLSNCGVLLRKHADKVGEAMKRYRARTDSETYAEEQFDFRGRYCPHVCASTAEADWRTRKNVSGAVTPNLRVTYLGVWDTVGALGIPATLSFLSPSNKKYEFHDTRLSSFVSSARHAVAIDERRKDFVPTLWTNVSELNSAAGIDPASLDAPYQQRWFPGTHSSVGGGGERRGLADNALDWIVSGARRMGLQLDAGEHSRIFELRPSHREHLEDTATPSWSYRAMNKLSAADRLPGPKDLYEVSQNARRRWAENPENLPNGKQYRPGTLKQVATQLDALRPSELGVGMEPPQQGASSYFLHQVTKDESLSGLAQRYLGNGAKWPHIHQLNLDRIEDPNRIYVGDVLRIPKL